MKTCIETINHLGNIQTLKNVCVEYLNMFWNFATFKFISEIPIKLTKNKNIKVNWYCKITTYHIILQKSISHWNQASFVIESNDKTKAVKKLTDFQEIKKKVIILWNLVRFINWNKLLQRKWFTVYLLQKSRFFQWVESWT